MATLAQRLAAIDAAVLEEDLFGRGHARVPGVLGSGECTELVRLYDQPEHFRKRIDMARHAYGIGEYQYFAEPLPPPVQLLRGSLYPKLAPIANRMLEALGRPTRYPAELEQLRARCHQAGQTEPTPLLLRYPVGGENRLHRDLYGPVVFPLQALILLSRPQIDFEGGELILLEQRARQQSRAEAIVLAQGELLVFPGYERPVQGRRGSVIAGVRHGVSRIHRGLRYSLGVIFHDAA